MTYQDIEDYMKYPLSDRQSHLRLDEACVCIGGYDSREYRGLLAHFLQTMIPTGNRQVNLCHRCNNHRCSNVRHLYRGTPSENLRDAIESGVNEPINVKLQRKLHAMSAEDRLEWKKKRSRNAGRKGGGSNKLSQEEIDHRKLVMLDCGYPSRGWIVRASRRLNITHTQISRFEKCHCPVARR